jgi:two-component system sensor histidine kinase YesM
MLGIIRIDADLKGIFNTVTATLNSSWYLLDEGQNLLLRFSGTSFEHCGNEEASAVLSSPGLISTENEDLGCRLIKPLNLHSIYSFHIWLYLIVGFGLLGLFSIVYFLILNSLVRRLVDFTSFLSGQNARELIPYHTEPSRDEIGSVIENYNSLISRINELIHNNYEVSIKAKDAMYYALQAQIEPHFIYNILENIRMSSEQHNDQETAHIIAAFGSYLRYTLNASSEPDYLETSLLNAKNYLEINKMRLDPYLSYDISIQTEPDRLYCPRFVIQTLLENAIEHGYEKNKPMHISVSVTGCDDSELSDEVRVTVTDDGRGINKDYLAVILQILSDSSTRPPTRHVGLRNVNDRLKAFNPDHSGLSIRPHAPRGTEISFQLWRKAADENTDRRR